MTNTTCVRRACLPFLLAFTAVAWGDDGATETPLPEHPRPDFQRPDWLNLNGAWRFRFDREDQGLSRSWFAPAQRPLDADFPSTITVPFPWGSKLSGVPDEADIGWYARTIQVPDAWKGKRIFLVVGASDWHTTAWLDGESVGEHRGGYTPFSFELTKHVRFGSEQRVVVRVDDRPRPFKLEGKQGYGRAAGIWQTVYLEARPSVAFETVHFTPDVDGKSVRVDVTLDQPSPADLPCRVRFRPHDRTEPVVTETIERGTQRAAFDIPLAGVRLWSLDDPYLYEVTAVLAGPDWSDDVSTYFGMRKISVGNLPGTDYPYVLLNDKPVYLQLTLDQAYHPEGFYTFPSDAFMREEILRTRQIGLNGQRIHIKVEVPRKLYWADRLGVLIMADVPNSWGPPGEQMRAETEYALRGMIKRDYNHPAILFWVNFNETWGLQSDKRTYLPETQSWVERIYRLTKELDTTRLVEDNSPCHFDHCATDINTWHAYLPGYAWRETLNEFCEKTFAGSTWNFIGGRKQDRQPMFNSECGNVWGYEGSSGDVDWSWDYHIMINEFRRHPKVCGWLYTEHHDVINEWNGYWRYDRSNKTTGMSDLAPGMTLCDLHSPFYIASERELCRTVAPGETVSVPLYASFFSGQELGSTMVLETELHGWNSLGTHRRYWAGEQTIACRPWMQQELPPMTVTMPAEPALAVLTFTLKDGDGAVLHRNFTTYHVSAGTLPRDETVREGNNRLRVVRFAPASFRNAQWSLKQWNILDGLKVNGAGAGFFEYVVPWPEDLELEDVAHASVRMELSAKQLFGKDREGATIQEGDFMRGKGTHDPSRNPNSYPMTDEQLFPSLVQVRVAGQSAGTFHLPDDSADHRGVLSWHSQPRDRKLREAGSYGVLVNAPIPRAALETARAEKQLIIRLEVDDCLAGGVAIYGERFGRFPLDPSVVFVLKSGDAAEARQPDAEAR